MTAWRAWTLVTLQFALIVGLVLAPSGQLWTRSTVVLVGAIVVGATAALLGVMAGIQLGRNLTPSPIPRAEATLEQRGIYGFIRHPIYTALLLAGAAMTIWGSSWVHLVLLALLVMLLEVKARAEERLLHAKFPEYREYQARTGRFFPILGRSSPRKS